MALMSEAVMSNAIFPSYCDTLQSTFLLYVELSLVIYRNDDAKFLVRPEG